jgi:hypothetical protein
MDKDKLNVIDQEMPDDHTYTGAVDRFTNKPEGKG